MSPWFPLLLDGVIIILLLGTIFTASVLSSRLKVLRDSRKDFEAMVVKFDQATARADAGVKGLQTAAQKTGEELQTRLERARALRDELSIMIESADSLARRLESAAPRTAERATTEAPAAAPRTIPEPPPLAPDPRSKAERDLLRALGRKEGSS